MPASYPVFLCEKEKMYNGEKYDIYRREDLTASYFVCYACVICVVFAGYVRRCGSPGCG